MKIKDLVKFNDGVAMVFEKIPEMKYKRLGKYIYGTNGVFYTCYCFDEPGGAFYAFGGRKFDIKLEDGEIIKCYGQWWDGGAPEISKILGINLVRCTANTIDNLKNCYVYHGYSADKTVLEKIIDDHEGPVFPYDDYEKIIKYDDLRSEYFNYKWKSEKAKKKLIANVKLFYSVINRIEKMIKFYSSK